MTKVFLSYARKDYTVALRIARDLQVAGIDVWFDINDLKGGDNWSRSIADAITKSDYLLALISDASTKSDWVQREITLALNTQQKIGGRRVIPILLEKTKVPFYLANIQYIDFTKSYKKGLQELIESIKYSNEPKPTQEVVPVDALAKAIADKVSSILAIEKISGRYDNIKNDPKLVFVIMAFKDDMEPVYAGIEAAAQVVGLTAKRVKDVVGDFRITDQIIQMIHSAFLVVADLTHERPNVYFELGYARGLGKKVVTVAREGTEIHFDVKDWNYISYIDSRNLERDLIKRFEYELAHKDE